MKKKDIPQDASPLNNFTKEVCYGVDENGKYATDLSTGWDVKVTALDVAWKDIEKRIEDAKQKVLRGEASPVLYYLELKLMDLTILSSYTGFWKWTIKRHMTTTVFNKLSENKMKKYAEAFDVSLEKLKNINA